LSNRLSFFSILGCVLRSFQCYPNHIKEKQKNYTERKGAFVTTPKIHKPSKKTLMRGQALIEMALMLPFLLMLVITSIELARVFYTQIVITNAAREGAYYLSTHPSDYDAGTGSAPGTLLAIQREASSSGIGEVTMFVTPINCCNLGDYSVQVTVNTNVNDLIIVGLLGNAYSVSVTKNDTMPVSAAVEMLVQP